MKVKILTEGGEGIGLGHISRCCSLYDEIYSRGINVRLVIHGDIANINILKERTIINDNWQSKSYLYNNIESTDYCIVDSYLASKSLYEIISTKAKRALYIDDIARIEYPKGIIVNPSLNTESIIYPTNDNNIYLLGCEYIILRTPFIKRKKHISNDNVKDVLITLGGSDIRNLTPCIMNSICRKYSKIKFNVVVNDTFNNIAIIEDAKPNNTELHYNVDEGYMSDLMISSDIAITAAGQTIYELLATATPFIAIRVIDNQNNNLNGLRKINPDQPVLDYTDRNFIKILEREFGIILDIDKRAILTNAYKDIVDGLGRKRIINALLGE